MTQHQFHSFVDPFQILVINNHGALRRVHCPFRVLCKEALEGLEPNRFYYVAMVSQGDNKVCYHINDKKYSHSYFSLFVI